MGTANKTRKEILETVVSYLKEKYNAIPEAEQHGRIYTGKVLCQLLPQLSYNGGKTDIPCIEQGAFDIKTYKDLVTEAGSNKYAFDALCEVSARWVEAIQETPKEVNLWTASFLRGEVTSPPARKGKSKNIIKEGVIALAVYQVEEAGFPLGANDTSSSEIKNNTAFGIVSEAARIAGISGVSYNTARDAYYNRKKVWG